VVIEAIDNALPVQPRKLAQYLPLWTLVMDHRDQLVRFFLGQRVLGSLRAEAMCRGCAITPLNRQTPFHVTKPGDDDPPGECLKKLTPLLTRYISPALNDQLQHRTRILQIDPVIT
jgi:hypothetical protein